MNLILPSFTALIIPGRDLVPPPELATDAPVLDIAHPFKISSGPVFRNELDFTVFYTLDPRISQRRDPHIPLIGEVRFDHCIGPIATWNNEFMGFGFFQHFCCFQISNDLFTGGETILPLIYDWCIFIDDCINGEDVYEWQIMAFADFVVIEIMGRCDFHATGPEFRIDIIIGDEGDGAAGKWQDDFL